MQYCNALLLLLWHRGCLCHSFYSP